MSDNRPLGSMPPPPATLPPPPPGMRQPPVVPTPPATLPPQDFSSSDSSENDDDEDFDLPPPPVHMPRGRRRSIKGFAPAISSFEQEEMSTASANDGTSSNSSQSSTTSSTSTTGTVAGETKSDAAAPPLPSSGARRRQSIKAKDQDYLVPSDSDNSVGSALRRRISHLGPAALSEKWYWMKHPTDGYVPARKVSGSGKKCVYETMLGESMRDTNENIISEGGDMYGVDPIPSVLNLSKTYYDMVHMDDTNEASILHNIRLRFDIDLFMTNVGSILVLVNPFQWFEHLYTREMIDMYHQWRVGDDPLAPHVYQIGYSAYHGLTVDRESQAVIISGESGAGKTEATKKCLQYLASIAGSSGMESKLLSANPVLEAFGNAKTVRNNNSSRFGKWMELHFLEDNWRIIGCCTINYLLEKVRLVQQGPTERNFHTFYQLLSKSERARKLREDIGFGGADGDVSVDPKDYDCLYKTGGCVSVPGMSEEEEFDDTLEAFETLGFEREEITGIYRIVGAILHLGNVSFAEGDDYVKRESMSPRSETAAKHASNLLMIGTDEMLQNIMAKTLYIGGSETIKNLSPIEANGARDSMIKSLYGRLFDWIVRRVNSCMSDVGGSGSSASGGEVKVVGILDIFGFEIFERNSFEQLCINFANEKLQQHFNQSTFKDEQQVYQDEEIQNVPDIQFADNEDLIAMMEKKSKPAGLLVLLDEEIRLSGSGSDENFLKKLGKVHVGSKRVRLKSVRDKQRRGSRNMLDTEFWVSHYAGDVKYDVLGFMDKCRDELFRNISEIIATSGIPLIANTLWGPDVDEDGRPKEKRGGSSSDGPRRGSGRASQTKKRMTLSGQFRRQLNFLMTKLSEATPHYIRCVKPNSAKKPKLLDAPMTLEQLTYSGIFEAVEIRKQGYPFRLSHRLFFCRYSHLLKQLDRMGALSEHGGIQRVLENHPAMASRNDGERARALSKIFGEIDSAMQSLEMGKTMVLYRAPEHRWMEERREMVMRRSVHVLQLCVRRVIAKMLRAKLAGCKKRILNAIDQRRSQELKSALEESRAMGALRLFVYRKGEEVLKVVLREERVVATLERLKDEDVEGPHFEVSSCFGFLFIFFKFFWSFLFLALPFLLCSSLIFFAGNMSCA